MTKHQSASTQADGTPLLADGAEERPPHLPPRAERRLQTQARLGKRLYHCTHYLPGPTPGKTPPARSQESRLGPGSSRDWPQGVLARCRWSLTGVQHRGWGGVSPWGDRDPSKGPCDPRARDQLPPLPDTWLQRRNQENHVFSNQKIKFLVETSFITRKSTHSRETSQRGECRTCRPELLSPNPCTVKAGGIFSLSLSY